MCGIFGIWQQDHKPVDLALVQQATTRLRHRGPDDEGYLLVNTQTGKLVACGGRETDERLNLLPIEQYFGEDFDLAFGYRRLSILDLSPAGHQPMCSPDGRYWIIYNGEIYNYLELRQELQQYGYHFRSGTDTEVILAAYDKWGNECQSRSNGMWAFAIWDAKQRSLFCSRDRYGVKPFYYSFSRNVLCWGSEIKALLGHVQAKPNLPVVKDYLTMDYLNYDPEQTFFDGVWALAPGSNLQIDLTHKDLLISQYWHQSYQQGPLNFEDAKEELKSLFSDAVRIRLRSDVPVGSSLSGGLDSSAIVCSINKTLHSTNADLNSSQHTVSTAYQNSPIDERQWINQIVNYTGVQPHFVFPSGEGLREELTKIIGFHDEPVGSSVVYAQWMVFKEARQQGLTVMLDGQGSDEVFGGYEASVPAYAVGLFEQNKFKSAWNALRDWKYRNKLPIATVFGVTLAEFEPWRRFKFEFKRRFGDHNPDPLHPSLAEVKGAIEHDPLDIYEAGPKRLQAKLIKYHTQSSLPLILRMLDRNSMAFGIETRTPFVDYRLVDYGFHLPDSYRIRDGWTKYIFRNAMQGVVPEAICWRPDKKGFPVPEAEWCRGPLRPMIDELFNSPSLARRGWLDQSQILNLNNQFQQAIPSVSSSMIWRWLDLEIWAQIFLGDS